MTTWLRAAAVAAVVALAGCSAGSSVSGQVTLDGQPLTSGTVTFHPTGRGPLGIGTIGPNGRYELRVGQDRSLPSGEYVVTVEATEPVAVEPPAGKGSPRPPGAPRRLTPDKYADKAATDLRFTVRPGDNSIDLPLKRK